VAHEAQPRLLARSLAERGRWRVMIALQEQAIRLSVL
jgi:hypothetical protein